MSKRVSLAALFAALSLTACVNVDATRLSGSQILPPVAPSSVTIYPTAMSITAPYRKIALLEANGDQETTSERDFLESMRRKAAKLGANGIILDPRREPHPSLRVAAAILDVKTTRYRHATAIWVGAPR